MITWKNTLSTQGRWVGHVDKMIKRALDAGYPYFEWNGWVYAVDDGKRTSIKTSDLDARAGIKGAVKQ